QRGGLERRFPLFPRRQFRLVPRFQPELHAMVHRFRLPPRGLQKVITLRRCLSLSLAPLPAVSPGRPPLMLAALALFLCGTASFAQAQTSPEIPPASEAGKKPVSVPMDPLLRARALVE